MAGLGYKDFSAGAVLTAAQVDGYLMEQSVMNFAGTAARGSALASVLSAGQMAHVGGGTITVYDGSAWQNVYPSSQVSGLTLITSAACGTASSVSINSCFSTTYEVYRIHFINPIAATGASQNLRLRLRLSGTDATTNYNRQYLDANSTTLTGARVTAQTSTEFMGISADGCSAGYMDIFNPALAQVTQFIALSLGGSATNTLGVNLYVANHTTATAYDGITFFPQTNAFNGGTIKIYGYRSA